MKERPILFNSVMVRAILDGRKTQTRRIVKPEPVQPCEGAYFDKYNKGTQWNWWTSDNKQCLNQIIKCPFGKVGDSLWVRETWGHFEPVYDGIEWIPDRPFLKSGERKFGKGYIDANIIWAVDGPFAWSDEDSCEEVSRWIPSIHMPRWASRINLEITDIKVERLNDISEEDAKAEGIEDPISVMMSYDPNADLVDSYVAAFCSLWSSVYGQDSWKSNPWVWVINFKRI